MSDAYIDTLLPYGVLVAVNRNSIDEITPSKPQIFQAEFVQVKGKGAFIEMIAGAFNCPEPYGRNWDALHEVVRDLDWFQWNSVVIHLMNARQLLSLPASTAVVMLKILSNSSCYWKARGKTFLTVLEGDRELYGLVYNVLSDWHLTSLS